ncbi:component of the RSC chromatin remodeling complex [Microthyrium microscopicum]|uniref:Component of the RSC chromatin remodeling complex n=1 Tax=Microthyrium microscopicum TaxID=703497 RepID=A0A6A6UA94_9PEZI|nr:component of the RSC chromatin remodeling complex [Microthyrium microscopicum]
MADDTVGASTPVQDVDTSMADDADVPVKKSPEEGAAIPEETANTGELPDAEDAEGVADAVDDTEAGEKKDGETADNPAEQALNKSALESAARSHLMEQAHTIILPSYSTWFDMNTIHSIEKKNLPEWFNGRNRSKTSATYKDTRDFMINTYRLNPAEYLTFTACRRNLCGDVCAIMRVHAFLEQWGLINYQVDPETRPSAIGPPFTGHFRLTADTPRGIQPHQPAPKSMILAGKPHPQTERLASSTPAPKSELTTQVRRNVYESNGKDATPSDSKAKATNGEASTNGTVDKALEESLKEEITKIYCHVCGNDCTRARYHNSKATPKYDICPPCFREHKFPQNVEYGDFTEMENKDYSIIPDRESEWSDEDLLLLLEGLEMYDEDWSKIADHVGSRTREECVLKFLQLQIEDEFVEPDPSDAEKPAVAMSYMGEGRAPFSQLFNPVLSTMAYLAGIADPNVTAAAVGKSVQQMQENMRARIENGATKSQKGKEKAAASGATAEGDKSSDAMDIEESSAVVTKDKNSLATHPMTTVPFALASARASALASHEERNLTRLVHTATNLQTQKLELKLQQFSEMENLLKLERKDLERRRQSLFLERLEFQRRMKLVEESFEKALSLGPDEGMAAVRETIKGAVNKGNMTVDKARGVDEIEPLGSDDTGFKQFTV